MSTIQDDFKPQSANTNYFRPTVGTHKVRILAASISGYSWWTEENDGTKKPHRIPMDGRPPVEFAESVKKFLTFPIYNYDLTKIQVWEITQSSIQTELMKLEKDADWGSLLDYDLSVERTGTDKMTTKYRISPKPKTSLMGEVEEAAGAGLPNLNALFDGGDPFEELVEDESLAALNKTLNS